MKHKISVTFILLGMFFVTQFVGLYVVNSYLGESLPYGLESAEGEISIISLIFSFVVAFVIIFFLMKYRWKLVIKVWFFLVVLIALAVSFNAIFKNYVFFASYLALAVSVFFAVFKIFKPNYFVHNLTEVLIYPGIGAIFATLLDPFSVIVLLILISIYDMWAVWRSGIMQKMAKFQMEELNVFGGFLIPTLPKKDREEIKFIRQKYKGKKIPKKIKGRKFQVNLAILGGGDVVFPIITAGVFLKFFGFVSAIFVIFGALAGLTYLFFNTEKGKSYPAMPYITAGIFLGVVLSGLFGFLA